MSSTKKKNATGSSKPTSSTKKKRTENTPEEILPRFSHIEDANQVPFFKYYNPRPDPVPKQENRKMKTSENSVKKPKCMQKQKDSKKEEKKTEKYVVPKSPKEKKESEERHKKEQKKYDQGRTLIVHIPSPSDELTVTTDTKNTSSEISLQID